jgi:hypothetical protein
MTDGADDYQVGYGKPPKETRWKTGQSGNHRKTRRRSVETPDGMADIIDRLLDEPIRVTINGAPKKISSLEAIVQNLTQKWLSGSGRALRVLLEYKEYFQRRQPSKPTKVKFLEGDENGASSPYQEGRTDV